MKKNGLYRRLFWRLFAVALAALLASPAVADITPKAPYQAEALADPDPAVYVWNSSIAYYNNHVLYVGEDGDIYGYDLDTAESTLVCDAPLVSEFFGVSGLMVADDDYLYLHDNGRFDGKKTIFRVKLTEPWPAYYEFLDTEANGFIYALTFNPWTGAIWFNSADFPGENLYLYQVNPGFDGVTLRGTFVKKDKDNSGTGPIIFKDKTMLLYGESVFMGDGYFHLVDVTTGAVKKEDYLRFTGGLACATYRDTDTVTSGTKPINDDNRVIYVTTGGGQGIYAIVGNEKTKVGTTDETAEGIVFDGSAFYVSEMVLSDFSGVVHFNSLWNPGAPFIFRTKPSRVDPGEVMTVLGENFGEIQGGSLVHIGRKTFDSTSPSIQLWSDAEIEIQIPDYKCKWFKDKDVRKQKVWVTVDGTDSNKEKIKVVKPDTCP